MILHLQNFDYLHSSGTHGQPISAEAEEYLKEMDLLPHMHMMADCNKEKASTHQCQDKVVLCDQPSLLARRSAGQ